jgi:two-component system, OmpR family, KDP operon response regulator KdpE
LLDRIRTVLARATLQNARVVTVGDLVVDLNRQMVQVANKPVQLTATEYEVLKVLALNAGRLLTQRRLAREVWGERSDDNSLQVLRARISTLRQKLDTDPAHPGHIATEPGVGYRLRIVPSA